ncbi:MFS transporter [Salinicola avicenniae]|uniref:MFS transporter n=1 Tax=Salinicola avicenniae TaxID=2916836 RepID=UPI0020730A4E|nr:MULTISPECIES: MFS transporter [unclassified Salinicola]
MQRYDTRGMTPAMTLLFAVTGGFAVGNLYWAQPLLDNIADTLGFSYSAAGLLITVTQLGYATGILLLVPLGDTLDRRKLIPLVLTAAAVSLLASALAPSYGVLLAAFAAVGLTTVSGQILIPLAGDLADEAQRGKVVGSIVSGLLTGILLSRTVSGLLADAFGWRSIYFLAAAVTFGLALLLARRLPADLPRERLGYGRLLLSVAGPVRRYRAVRAILAIGACAFGVFTMFWTGLTFLLSAAPFDYSVTQIGLVGLVGLAGALAARKAGKLHDRGLTYPATGAALLLALASLALAALGQHRIIWILLAVLLIDIAIQSLNVLNQTRLLSIEPASRSRLNTAFVFCNFVGGALGSLLAGVLWSIGGWSLLMLVQGAIILIAAAVWALCRRHLSSTG